MKVLVAVAVVDGVKLAGGVTVGVTEGVHVGVPVGTAHGSLLGLGCMADGAGDWAGWEYGGAH